LLGAGESFQNNREKYKFPKKEISLAGALCNTSISTKKPKEEEEIIEVSGRRCPGGVIARAAGPPTPAPGGGKKRCEMEKENCGMGNRYENARNMA
jgi:hypothetical protein